MIGLLFNSEHDYLQKVYETALREVRNKFQGQKPSRMQEDIVEPTTFLAIRNANDEIIGRASRKLHTESKKEVGELQRVLREERHNIARTILEQLESDRPLRVRFAMNPRKAFEQTLKRGANSKPLGLRLTRVFTEFLDEISSTLHELDEDLAQVTVLDWEKTIASSGRQLKVTLFIGDHLNNKKEFKIVAKYDEDPYDVARKIQDLRRKNMRS
jgi:hypothetical protein